MTVRRDNVEYHAGRKAFAEGTRFDECPYLSGGDRAARWRLGWQEARDAAPSPPQFHLSRFAPTQAWPNGGWSLYRITGDEIAARIDVGPGGQVDRRDPWPGYIGCFATLAEVTAAIEESSK